MNNIYSSPNIPVDCWSNFYICSMKDDYDLSYCRLYFRDWGGRLYIMFCGSGGDGTHIYKHGYSITFMGDVYDLNSINSATNTRFQLIESSGASISILHLTYNSVKAFAVFDDCVQEAHKLIMEYRL